MEKISIGTMEWTKWERYGSNKVLLCSFPADVGLLERLSEYFTIYYTEDPMQASDVPAWNAYHDGAYGLLLDAEQVKALYEHIQGDPRVEYIIGVGGTTQDAPAVQETPLGWITGDVEEKAEDDDVFYYEIKKSGAKPQEDNPVLFLMAVRQCVYRIVERQ